MQYNGKVVGKGRIFKNITHCCEIKSHDNHIKFANFVSTIVGAIALHFLWSDPQCANAVEEAPV
jgi:hypothetical protein